VEHVRDSNSEMVSTLFHGARPIAIDSEKSVIRIGFPSSAKFNKRKIESDQNSEIITESLHAVFGVPLRPAFELLAPVTFNCVCFRRRDRDAAGQRRMLQALLDSGTAFLGPALVKGQAGLRACFMNLRTTTEDVDVILDSLDSLAC
jgi:hypothetical protein